MDADALLLHLFPEEAFNIPKHRRQPGRMNSSKAGFSDVAFHLCGATQLGKLGIVLWEE